MKWITFVKLLDHNEKLVSYMKYAGYYFDVIYHIICSQNNNIKLNSIYHMTPGRLHMYANTYEIDA